MKCGDCKWHFDLEGKTEHADVKNCLARSWVDVYVVFTTADAECNLPERFENKETV